MQPLTPMRTLILRQTESALDKVWDKVFVKIEREMFKQVEQWNQRWPRHKFRMALIHGGLLVMVDPPIMGEDMPEHIGSLWVRGPIADLQRDIKEFDDFLCGVATVMGSPADGIDTDCHTQTKKV